MSGFFPSLEQKLKSAADTKRCRRGAGEQQGHGVASDGIRLGACVPRSLRMRDVSHVFQAGRLAPEVNTGAERINAHAEQQDSKNLFHGLVITRRCVCARRDRLNPFRCLGQVETADGDQAVAGGPRVKGRGVSP